MGPEGADQGLFARRISRTIPADGRLERLGIVIDIPSLALQHLRALKFCDEPGGVIDHGATAASRLPQIGKQLLSIRHHGPFFVRHDQWTDGDAMFCPPGAFAMMV